MPPDLASPPERFEPMPDLLEELAEQLEAPPEPLEPPPVQSAATLVSGIVGDLKNLIEQQFQLTRMQVEAELRQRLVAVAVVGAGVVVLFVAAMLVCFSATHLLHWVSSPVGTDPAAYPLWICYAAVAALLGLTGGVLAWTGRSKFRSVAPFHNPVSGLFQEAQK